MEFDMLIPKNKTASQYNLPNWSYQEKKTLTSDNFAHEGRTGVDLLIFLIGRYLWHPKIGSKIKNMEKLKKVTQRSHWGQGSPQAGWPVDRSGATPNPIWHFYLELFTKNYLLTPPWPLITWPFCFEIFLYPIHFLSQNMKCVGLHHRELLLCLIFRFLAHNWPSVTLTDTKNDRAHLRNMADLCTKFDSSPTFPSWVIAYRSKCHTHTPTHPRQVEYKGSFANARNQK